MNEWAWLAVSAVAFLWFLIWLCNVGLWCFEKWHEHRVARARRQLQDALEAAIRAPARRP